MENWSFRQALPRDFNSTPTASFPYPSGAGAAFAIDGNRTSIGQTNPYEFSVPAAVGQAVELVLCLLSICMGLGIFLPSILRSNERTLRFQLIIGLSCSDFFLATLSFSEVIAAMAGKHPGTGSVACDITGFLTSTFVFAQYLWAIAMASATFLLLRKPTSPTTAWMSANWGWAWIVFYAISFSQAGIWWSKSRYELEGGFCYYGEQNALGGDLIQLLARAVVLVIVSSLYANLFLFLRRPSIGIAGCASNTSSRRTSANTQAPPHSGTAEYALDLAPWEQIDLGYQIEEETLPEKLKRLSQPTLSELGTPLRPDLQVEIPFLEDYFAPDIEAETTPSRTRSTTAPAASSTQQTTPVSPPKLFALSFSFGNPTTPAPRPVEISPMDSPKATYHTPPRRSSLARHHRPSISDSSSHASPPRRVSFSIAPLGPTRSSPDIEAFTPPSFAPPSFADFTFGRPVVALMESSSFSSDGTNQDASQPTPSPTSHNLLSSPSSRRSSLPTSSLLLSQHPPTVGASRIRHLPPSSLRRCSLPIPSLDPIVLPTTYAAQEASPATFPALLPRRTSLVAHLAEAQLVLLARGGPGSRRESCDSATTAFDPLPSPTEGPTTKIMGGGSSCNGSEDSSKSFVTDCRSSVPVFNRKESDGSTGTTSTGQGSNSFCSPTSSSVESSTPHKHMENSSSSTSAAEKKEEAEEEKIAPPPFVPRHASTVSSADTLTEDQPKSEHPNLPKRKSFTRRQTLAEMSPSHVEDARSVVEGPSKATYMKRKASQLMVYLPSAYLFMFVVFLARFIDDRMHPGDPNKGIHALSRWVLVGQGVINGAIYGIVEHRARTSIRKMEKADEERRIEEERIIQVAETKQMVLINTERRETRLRRQELSDESDGEGER